MSEPLAATVSQDGKTKIKIEKMESLKSAALNPKQKKRKVKKEKDSPMLLMRAPPPPRGYSVRRVLDLSKPKVGKSNPVHPIKRLLAVADCNTYKITFRKITVRITCAIITKEFLIVVASNSGKRQSELKNLPR